MKKLSQYAIALDGHVAPPPSASHERELLSFHVEDVIFLTECVAPPKRCERPPLGCSLTAARARVLRPTAVNARHQAKPRSAVVARLRGGRPQQADGCVPAAPRAEALRRVPVHARRDPAALGAPALTTARQSCCDACGTKTPRPAFRGRGLPRPAGHPAVQPHQVVPAAQVHHGIPDAAPDRDDRRARGQHPRPDVRGRRPRQHSQSAAMVD